MVKDFPHLGQTRGKQSRSDRPPRTTNWGLRDTRETATESAPRHVCKVRMLDRAHLRRLIGPRLQAIEYNPSAVLVMNANCHTTRD